MFNASHPDLRLAVKRIQECNIIKYAAYRTAAKLRVLQRALFMDEVPLRIITGIFEKHRLQTTENSVLLNVSELESVLSDVYFVIKKERIIDLDIDRTSSLAIEVLFGIFDRGSSGKIQVFSAKLGLAILSQAKPREKYQHLFQQLSDHNNCLSRKKLDVILKNMTAFAEYLNEEHSFSRDLIPGTIDSCFDNHSGTLGISEDMFLTWLLQDPQLLVWLSTSYRMQISEMACHGAKCAVCKIYPIVGLRYRCLRCLSYNQCQTCFFVGKFNKKHKLKHPVQEYCRQITSCQSTKAFLSTLKNKVRKTGHKLQYLPAQKVERPENHTESSQLLDELDVSSRTVIHGSRISLHVNPQKELHSIIIHLERENNHLLLEFESLSSQYKALQSNTQLKEHLLNHRTKIETQVQRLKLLKNIVFRKRELDNKILLESTPVVVGALKTRVYSTDNLSPIAKTEGVQLEVKNSAFDSLTWDKLDLAPNQSAWKPFAVSDMQSEITFLSKPCASEDAQMESKRENEFALSTWIGGTQLRDLDDSSDEGFSWLNKQDSVHDIKTHDGENKENISHDYEEKKALKKLDCDVDQIIGKLQKLLTNTSKLSDEVNLDEKSMHSAEVDSLLSELMHAFGQSDNYH